jgi:hypothetical protein
MTPPTLTIDELYDKVMQTRRLCQQYHYTKKHRLLLGNPTSPPEPGHHRLSLCRKHPAGDTIPVPNTHQDHRYPGHLQGSSQNRHPGGHQSSTAQAQT